MALDTAEKAAKAAADALDRSTKRVEEITGLLKQSGDLIEKLTARVNELQTTVTNQAVVIAEHAAVIARNAETTMHAVNSLNDRCSKADQTVLDVAQSGSAGLADLVNQIENHRIETATLISRLRDPLPKALMIDHAGHLIAIDHTGDHRDIGPVRGEAGQDAPRIEAAGWKAGHIVLNMSDRTSHLIELPALEPVDAGRVDLPPARTPEGDKAKAAIRMGIVMEAAAGGKSVRSIAKIAKTYNLTPVQVRAIIREHENETAKKRGNLPAA